MFTSEEEDELDAKYCELAFEDWTAFYGCIFSVERDAADGADQLWDCYELYINQVSTQPDATIDATTTDCDTRFDAVTNLKYFWDM